MDLQHAGRFCSCYHRWGECTTVHSWMARRLLDRLGRDFFRVGKSYCQSREEAGQTFRCLSEVETKRMGWYIFVVAGRVLGLGAYRHYNGVGRYLSCWSMEMEALLQSVSEDALRRLYAEWQFQHCTRRVLYKSCMPRASFDVSFTWISATVLWLMM
jgi:hypothetical protein